MIQRHELGSDSKYVHFRISCSNSEKMFKLKFVQIQICSKLEFVQIRICSNSILFRFEFVQTRFC
jgi:hypothetical protein